MVINLLDFSFIKNFTIKKAIFILFGISISIAVDAQFGGFENYSFLRTPVDAYTTALGGQNVACMQSNLLLFLNNPALLNTKNGNSLNINFAPLLGIANTSTISHSRSIKKYGDFGIALQYNDFGSFVGTDAGGNLTNNFKANEYSLAIGHSRKVNNITIGVNLKLAGSNLESYSSFAVLADIGGYFQHPTKDISYGLVIKNMGASVKNYTDMPQNLPFDVQMGFSIHPYQMPMRLSINAHHLHRWNIVFKDENSIQNTIPGFEKNSKITIADKIARHLVFGLEILLSKNFHLNLGYNQLLRKELQQQNVFSFSGFSYGILLESKKLNFSFGHQGYHTAGGLNQITVGLKLKKKNSLDLNPEK